MSPFHITYIYAVNFNNIKLNKIPSKCTFIPLINFRMYTYVVYLPENQFVILRHTKLYTHNKNIKSYIEHLYKLKIFTIMYFITNQFIFMVFIL